MCGCIYIYVCVWKRSLPTFVFVFGFPVVSCAERAQTAGEANDHEIRAKDAMATTEEKLGLASQTPQVTSRKVPTKLKALSCEAWKGYDGLRAGMHMPANVSAQDKLKQALQKAPDTDVWEEPGDGKAGHGIRLSLQESECQGGPNQPQLPCRPV